MDVTVVNTPLPVSAEIKVKNFQIPWNLILNSPGGFNPAPQSLLIKNANTDYDLLINFVNASGIGVVFGNPMPNTVGLGIIITDNSLATTNKNSSILLTPNVFQTPGAMTAIVVKAHQACSFYLNADNPTILRANFFASGMIMRS